jgi:hypothetical protein
VTKTPLPFAPEGVCVFPFQDDGDGVWEVGEHSLANHWVHIYGTTTSTTPEYALAIYRFTGAETQPRCFDDLNNQEYRIQLDPPPSGGWGRIFSDPVGPVRVVENVSHVWAVDVENGKAVFWSYSGGAPAPTSTVSPLQLCGVITLYDPPTPSFDGTISMQGYPSYSIQRGASIFNSNAMRPGASGCLNASVNSAGYIFAGSWASHTPTPTSTRTPTFTPTSTATRTPTPSP